MSIILKVQRTDGKLTENSLKASGFEAAQKGEVITFHAYSDTMKARILEKIAAGHPYQVTVDFSGPARNGEWLEPLETVNAVKLN